MLLAAAAGCGGDGDGDDGALERRGSKVVDERVTYEGTPETYSIAYEVSASGGGGVQRSTETLVAQRPFASSVVVDVDGEVTARRASRFGALAVEGNGNVVVLGVPPSIGTGDVRPDAVLGWAVEEGLAELRERREVEGITCQVFRLGTTASDGSLVPVGSLPGEHADLCVDGRGLVLEEWWERDGVPLRHRLAVEVHIGVDVDDDDFTLDGEGDARRRPSDGRVVESEVEHPGLVLPDPPGFEHEGRVDVTAAQVSPEVPARSSVADVWRDGADFVVLDQGPGEVDPHPYAIDVEIGDLGPAQLIPDLRASELRMVTADGRTVRLYGTIRPDRLLELAATLRPGL